MERSCTRRPPDEVLSLADLLGSRWVYLDQKRSQMVNLGFGPLVEGLYGMEAPLRAQDMRRPAFHIFGG